MDPSGARRYIQVARALRESAAGLDLIAEEGDRYGNALAIVAIHAAIAYADALSIAYGGFKSVEGEHEKAVEALQAALGHRADPERVRSLLRVVKQKDTASYQGVYYTIGEARALVENMERFAEWADEMYERRPRDLPGG